MQFNAHEALRCPLDSLPLELQDNSLRCPNNHSFDIARQGYANLLGAQDKRSRDPGDSKAMIAARHSFLEAAYFEPIAEQLCALVAPHLAGAKLIVDAGCGEGYYLHKLRQSLADHHQQAAPAIVGFDISKWAVQAAARRFPATWLVASNRNIPLAEASADLVMDVFGFPDFAAFERLLNPTGMLLRVQAGTKHLLELREVIYPVIKTAGSADTEPAGFSRVAQCAVRYQIPKLGRTAISQLLGMTPHLYRASAQGKQRAAQLEELSVSVDVTLELFQRLPTN
jgi:23S rRNA (guanine745-N1)-methyltransferase